MQHTVAAIQKSQWRLGFIGWRTGVRSQIILSTHMVSSCTEEGERDRKQKERRDSGKNGEVGKNETVKTVIENAM